MRTSFRVRAAAVAAAVALPFAGLLAAAPAHAAETAAIELDQTTFVQGEWGTGFHITGTGFLGTGDVTVSVSTAYGPSSGEGIYETTVTPAADGTIDAQVVPTGLAPVTGAAEYPKVSVGAHQAQDGTEELIFSNFVTLTITESDRPDPTVTFPQVVSPEQLAAGLTVNFAGFDPNEPIFYGVLVIRNGEPINEFNGLQETVADGSGAGSFVVTIPGAQVGDSLAYYVTGRQSLLEVEAETPVVAAPPAPAPADATPKAALAETGVELTAGLVGAGVLALGVFALVARRRFASR
ncbi:hypothetical protein ACWKWP_08170 [Agromyces soli]